VSLDVHDGRPQKIRLLELWEPERAPAIRSKANSLPGNGHITASDPAKLSLPLIEEQDVKQCRLDLPGFIGE